MPQVPSDNIFGIPAFTYIYPYSGKSTYNSTDTKWEYSNVCVCMYSTNDTSGGRVYGVFASTNSSDFTALSPYQTSTPYQYTYDGQTVYWSYGCKYANGHTSPDYLDPTIDYYEDEAWYRAAIAAGGSGYNWSKKVAWLMVYGGYGGVSVTYSMSGCTGDPNNPTFIPTGETITATFTPNQGKAFDSTSATVTSANPVSYAWVPSTGTLTITGATAAVSVTVRGYDGYAVTYSMSGCSGSSDNPSIITEDATSTAMSFTANSGRAFDAESVRIAGTGYPSGDVQFNWNPETGVLTVGRVTSAISVSIIARVIDPYAPAGYTQPQDGNGSFDFTGDGVTMSTLPTTSFVSTGFVRIYNPDLTQLSSLASYMWTDQTFIQTLINHAKQLLENPIESIISLNLLPVPIPKGTAEEVKVLFIPTGVNMPPVTAQFVEVDCGSVQLTETYGSALDYSPYTKIHCFLPYIGTVTLDTDEVMGKTISIKYRVDIATGVCVAHIIIDGYVFYQFSGHCAVAMPITSADFSTYIAAAIGTAKAVAGVAAAGAGAPGVAAALTGTPAPRSSHSKTVDTARNPSTNRQIQTGTRTRETTSEGATFGEIATKAAVNTVGSIMGSKTVVEHSGGFTGNSGYMGVRRPYLVVEIPNIANPQNYSKYNGFPSMITARLGDCTGYTEVQSVQLTGFGATNPELTQIGELLKAGVIL